MCILATWICSFGDFFTDCTMGFFTIKPPFGIISLELVPGILCKSKFIIEISRLHSASKCTQLPQWWDRGMGFFRPARTGDLAVRWGSRWRHITRCREFWLVLVGRAVRISMHGTFAIYLPHTNQPSVLVYHAHGSILILPRRDLERITLRSIRKNTHIDGLDDPNEQPGWPCSIPHRIHVRYMLGVKNSPCSSGKWRFMLGSTWE